MDPITAALILANTLAQLELRYVEGLDATQAATRSTRIFDLIEHVLAVADKAHKFLHRGGDKPEATDATT